MLFEKEGRTQYQQCQQQQRKNEFRSHDDFKTMAS
jgi:hypothetical protein